MRDHHALLMEVLNPSLEVEDQASYKQMRLQIYKQKLTTRSRKGLESAGVGNGVADSRGKEKLTGFRGGKGFANT